MPTKTKNKAKKPTTNESDRSYVVAWILSVFLGPLGLDRMYRGFIGTGILKLITFGGFGIWTLIDWLLIGFGKPKDKLGLKLKGYEENKKTINVLTAVILILNFILVPIILLIVIFITLPAIQSSVRNTDRKVDIASLANSINKYKLHNNSLPVSLEVNESSHSVKLCSDNCANSNYESLKTKYYDPTNIVFQPLSTNLVVPSVESVYIVDNASCNAAHSGLQATPVNNAVAILYALEDSTKITKYQCEDV